MLNFNIKEVIGLSSRRTTQECGMEQVATTYTLNLGGSMHSDGTKNGTEKRRTNTRKKPQTRKTKIVTEVVRRKIESLASKRGTLIT